MDANKTTLHLSKQLGVKLRPLTRICFSRIEQQAIKHFKGPNKTIEKQFKY